MNGTTCGTAASSSLTIFINLPPTADAGDDRDICLNEVTQLGVPSTPGYSYVWTSVPTDTSINFPNDQSNPFVSPSVTTEYTVEVTNINGETAEDSVMVTVIPLPVVDAGSADTICVGESIQLGAPTQGGFSYAWTSIPAGFTSTLADPIVAPIVSTRYFLTVTTDVTGTPGCQDTADVVITVENPPVIDAGTDETICEDQSNFTLASATGPSSGVSYQWEALGGDGSFDNATLLNPTYTVGSDDIIATSVTFRLTAVNNPNLGNCDPVTDQIELTIEEPVLVSAGANGTICETGYLLNSAAASNEDSVLWTSSGNGTFTNPTNLVTTYTPGTSDISLGTVNLTLRATNDCGFEENTIEKTIVDTPTADAGTDITISQGATANLSGITTNASSVLWTVTSGNGTLVNPTSEIAQYISDPAEEGPVTLTLTAEPFTVNGTDCGITATSELRIFINLPPTADAGDDRDICLNEVTQLGVPSTPGYSYVWTSVPTDTSINFPNDQSNPFVSPSVTTEYTVEVTNINGETAEDSVMVTVIPLPVVDAGSADTICVGESIQLGAPTQGGFSYAWTSIPAGYTSDLADPIVNPIVSTRYFLTVTTDVTGTPGCQDTADVVITVENPPVIDAGTDETICEDQSNFTLASATGPSSGVSYQWEALGGDGSFDNFTLLNPTYTVGSRRYYRY